MSEKEIQTLVREQLLPEIRGNALKSCVDYIYGKQHIVAFQNFPLSRKLNPLELMHTDVFYVKDRSFGGAIYFVTIIDNFARKIWCFALKSKH